MADTRGELDAIVGLVASVEPQAAEERLNSLIASLDRDELVEWGEEIRGTIAHFHRKRANRLYETLEAATSPESRRPSLERGKAVRVSQAWLNGRVRAFRTDLEGLSNYHIFQWNTQYPDVLNRYMAEFVDSSGAPDDTATLCRQIASAMDLHAAEVFQKGFDYVTRRDDEAIAHMKSISGLQRLLDIVVEFYSTRIAMKLMPREAVALRAVVSSMLLGVLTGYMRVDLGSAMGKDLLSTNLVAWVPTLAFLTGQDARAAADALSGVSPSDQIQDVVVPLNSALDVIASEASTHVPVPWIARYQSRSQCLQVTLKPSPRSAVRGPVEVYAFLSPERAPRAALEELATSESALVVVVGGPDGSTDASGPQDLQPVTLAAGEPGLGMRAILPRLRRRVLAQQAPMTSAAPITDNYASKFPLQEPRLVRSFYHVQRPSVRRLLSSFDRRNGVRLWCSVRRSGKTTAGQDLGSESGDSIVISQTCEDTGELANGSHLYQSIKQVLDEDERLGSSFLIDTLDSCSDSGEDVRSKRVVLVVDEYETLFGEITRALRRNPDARYTVIQPLLNQMVAFSRENLLVLMGQQPNAHFIMMDQNQLSPLILQDPFPLFVHTPGESEFAVLLSKVLSSQIDFDTTFSDRVFDETAGHPYLTVNLMVDFVDWLIRERRSHSSLHFTVADFSRFAQARLRRTHLALASAYNVFRDGVVADALSNEGRNRSPWLYVVYSCLRDMATSSPDNFTVTRDDFREICDRVGAPLGFRPDAVLSAGSQANFFAYTDRTVAPKIRLLARLAAVAPVSATGL